MQGFRAAVAKGMQTGGGIHGDWLTDLLLQSRDSQTFSK